MRALKLGSHSAAASSGIRGATFDGYIPNRARKRAMANIAR